MRSSRSGAPAPDDAASLRRYRLVYHDRLYLIYSLPMT
jgi:hypothetical protein